MKNWLDKYSNKKIAQSGQDIINASKDVPAIEGSQFDTKRIVNYQPGVMSGNEPGFYLYSKLQTDGDFNVDRDREFIKQNEMLTVQRTPQWVEYMKGKAKTKPAQALASYQDGGVIDDDMGQWKYPGEITRINSNNITMQGVNYPVLGVSDTGDTKMMYPGENYQYEGSNVTEYPQVAQDGSFIQKKDSLDNKNILNFKKPYVEKEIKTLQNQAKNSRVVVFAESPKKNSTYDIIEINPLLPPKLKKLRNDYFATSKTFDSILETNVSLNRTLTALNNTREKYLNILDKHGIDYASVSKEGKELNKQQEIYYKKREKLEDPFNKKLEAITSNFYDKKINPKITDSTFIKEAQNVKDFYKRTNPSVNVDVVPMYENPKLMKKKLKGLTQFDKVAIFGHSGNQLAGIENDSISQYLNNSNVKDCYFGTCHGEDLIEQKGLGLNNIKNKTLNYRPSDKSWYGFNPDAKTFDEGMWSRNSVMGKTDYQYKEQITPIKEGKTHIVKKVQNGGKIITAQNGLRQEQKSLQNLDNLINFTNYNTPQPGGWLDKY